MDLSKSYRSHVDTANVCSSTKPTIKNNTDHVSQNRKPSPHLGTHFVENSLLPFAPAAHSFTANPKKTKNKNTERCWTQAIIMINVYLLLFNCHPNQKKELLQKLCHWIGRRRSGTCTEGEDRNDDLNEYLTRKLQPQRNGSLAVVSFPQQHRHHKQRKHTFPFQNVRQETGLRRVWL